MVDERTQQRHMPTCRLYSKSLFFCVVWQEADLKIVSDTAKTSLANEYACAVAVGSFWIPTD